MNAQNPHAVILTIGDELLIGQTIDTNSAWMARELNAIGLKVTRRVAVGDRSEDIRKALDEESQQASVILITGGLGPTADDITKPLLCEYFGGQLVVDPNALANVKYIFETILKRPLLERNLKQAEVPDCCTVLQNKRGTAPGMWFEKNQCIYVSMPGVPYEMKGMMSDYVLPELHKRFRLPPLLHRTLVTAGVGESFLAERIQDFERQLPPDIKLAYLPSYGMVKLRLSLASPDPGRVNDLELRFSQLQQQLSDVLVVNEDIALAEVVGRQLTSLHKTVATAESCTGGFVAHLLTTIPGSSRYFKGSLIAYSNEVKQSLLQVSQDTLDRKGAVSEETVREMVAGCLKQVGTNYALAVSGIMGPEGGSPEKPVGTVWMAVGNGRSTLTQRQQFRFDRQRNTELTANFALNLLRKFITENP